MATHERWRPATNPETGDVESRFREEVRNILNLTWDVRDEQIFERLRRLQDQDVRLRELDIKLRALDLERLAGGHK